MNLRIKIAVWLAVGCLFQTSSQAQISIAPTNAPRLAQNITMAWDASPDSAVTGYNLYYGTTSGVYAGKLDVGNVLTTTVNITPRGVLYYFAAAAYDANGIESPFSNEISTNAPNLIPQSTLSLSPAGPLAYGSTNSLSTSGGSGLGSVTYSVVSGPGYLTADSNNLVVTAATGTIILTATKAADDVYLSASVTNTISLTAAYQSTLVFTPTATQTYGTTNVLSATGGSGSGAVTFSVVSGPGSISGNNLVITAGSGSVVLQATKAADVNYNSSSATATVTAVKANQTISFAALGTKTTTNVVTLAASATSMLPVTYAVVSGPGKISAGQLTFQKVGTVLVAASQAGDGNYLSATSVTNSVTVISYLQPPGKFKIVSN